MNDNHWSIQPDNGNYWLNQTQFTDDDLVDLAIGVRKQLKLKPSQVQQFKVVPVDSDSFVVVFITNPTEQCNAIRVQKVLSNDDASKLIEIVRMIAQETESADARRQCDRQSESAGAIREYWESDLLNVTAPATDAEWAECLIASDQQ